MLEVGYDFGIAKNLSVGAALTFVSGALKYSNVKYSNGTQASVSTTDPDSAESLRSIGLNIGLRYNL